MHADRHDSASQLQAHRDRVPSDPGTDVELELLREGRHARVQQPASAEVPSAQISAAQVRVPQGGGTQGGGVVGRVGDIEFEKRRFEDTGYSVTAQEWFRSAIAADEPRWFNHQEFFHVRTLPADLADGLLVIDLVREVHDTGRLPPNWLLRK